MSLRARLLNGWLRRVEKPALERAADPLALRRQFERKARVLFHAPRGTQMQWQVLEHAQRRIEALDIVPGRLESDLVLLYFHGGGFVFGSPRTHAAMVGALGHRLQARAVMPRYRLAPEAPFPAALEDARGAWEALCASGVAPTHIMLGGDSAGGALALSLLGQLIADRVALPAGVFCFSPLTDLAFTGESFLRNAKAEAMLPARRADTMAQMYLNGHDPTDPRVSPLHADFRGSAPVWLSIGDTEILHDDSLRMAQRLKEAGVPTALHEQRDLPHVWPLFHNILPEARTTLDDLAAWIRRQQVPRAES